MRRPRRVDAPAVPSYEAVTVDEARESIWQSMIGYLGTPNPDRVLLIAAPPGVGKTTLAVRLAEMAAGQGKRVIYAGPRHDLFPELQALSARPGDWYEWLPRQDGVFSGGVRTCEYTEAMATILHRGYSGIRGCTRYCGHRYISKECVWHGQRGVKQPIIYGQHQHVWGGHPLEFDLAIGDESPLSAFMHRWNIPSQWIYPKLLPASDAVAPVIRQLKQLAEEEIVASGPELLELLGGAENVRARLSEIPVLDDEVYGAPGDAQGNDYLHLLPLCRLLCAEAVACLAGQRYPHRVGLTGKGLFLLLRRQVNEQFPQHLIWLDATANSRIYEQLTGRSVERVAPRIRIQGRVHQVIDRSYGKARTEEYLPELQAIVRRIASKYTHPAIISHKAFVSKLHPDLPIGHYYAERGTNEFRSCDALIVIGVPQPSRDNLQAIAAMVFSGRMEAFDTQWAMKDVKFVYQDHEGNGLAFPVAGFWKDDDLNSLLWQTREAEIIHAVHRVRPIIQDADVWMVHNLPIEELPPTTVRTSRELLAFVLLLELGVQGQQAQRYLDALLSLNK